MTTLFKEWYEKAADNGNASAQNNLGYMYEHGEGVEQDYAKALEWYQKAADNGDEYANKKIVDVRILKMLNNTVSQDNQ